MPDSPQAFPVPQAFPKRSPGTAQTPVPPFPSPKRERGTGNGQRGNTAKGVPLAECAECQTTMTLIYPGQTRHPGCHGCQRPSAACPDCLAERRAHQRDKGRLRHQQFTKRTETTR